VTTLLAFVFLLGVLIFVHELGHYMMAKRIGIRVLTFSLGFGPKILNFRRNGTDYCVSAIPLGGYVKMAGETPDEPRSGQPDEFLSRSKWERFQVLVMGPVMNIALAIILTAVVLMFGAEVLVYEDQAPVVGAIAAASPAERAGIRPGDRILAVGGQAVSTWSDVYMKVGAKPNREIPITVLRDGKQLHLWAKTGSEGQFDSIAGNAIKRHVSLKLQPAAVESANARSVRRREDISARREQDRGAFVGRIIYSRVELLDIRYGNGG
jgi:regulator of sigma E protease